MNHLSNPQAFAENYLLLNDIKVLPSSQLKKHGRLIDYQAVFDAAWLDYRAQLNDHNAKLLTSQKKVKGFTESDLGKAFRLIFHAKNEEAKASLIASIKFDPTSNLTELHKFCRAVVGNSDPKTVAVFLHWLWQVKRKLFNKTVFQHLMIVLFGATNAGKTEAVKRLCAPFDLLKLQISVTQVTDERYFFSLADNYICVLDEMQGASRSDIDRLKFIITTPNTSSRGLYTQIVATKPQNCTFIGTTNRPLDELIFDTTGMRRFFQFKTLEKMDWAAINTIDYLKIWRSVDEENDLPYIADFMPEITAEQKSWEAEDPLKVWLDSLHWQPTEHREAGCFVVSVDDAFRSYSDWSDRGRCHTLTINTFGKRMKNLGFSSKPVRIGGKTKKAYLINTADHAQEVTMETLEKNVFKEIQNEVHV